MNDAKAQSMLGQGSLLSERARLVIMSMLVAAKKPLDFNTLLAELQLTKGNLSSHLRKLEDGQLIEITKEFIDRKPRTTYKVTENGRGEMKRYVGELEQLVKFLGKK